MPKKNSTLIRVSMDTKKKLDVEKIKIAKVLGIPKSRVSNDMVIKFKQKKAYEELLRL